MWWSSYHSLGRVSTTYQVCIQGRCTVQGLPTIRAYDAGARFYELFLEYLDTNGAWWFCFVVTSRWIGFRLDTIAAIMLTAGTMLAMAIHNKVVAQFPWLTSSLLFFSSLLCKHTP